MSVADDLRAYVMKATDEDEPFLESCYITAVTLVSNEIGSATTVPSDVFDRCVLEVAAALFHRRKAPSGVTQFSQIGSTQDAVRVSADPLAGVRPILRAYLGPVVA